MAGIKKVLIIGGCGFVGSHLARLELNIMFNEFLPRLKNPKFAETPKFVRSYFVNAMKEMNITFDKEAS